MLQLEQLGASILGNKKQPFSVSVVKNKPVMIAQNGQLEKKTFLMFCFLENLYKRCALLH